MKISQSAHSNPCQQQTTNTYTLTRTFVFQREETHQSLIIDTQITAYQSTVNLSPLFQLHCPLPLHKVSIYDPDTNRFLSLDKLGADQSGLLPRTLLETTIVMVRFRRRQEEGLGTETDSGVESGLESGRQKKDRSKERTIGEAIELVKKWRMVHLDSSKSGLKKLSLADAARSIGISKKSLDDYYYQLRLGEFYNFDFAGNLSEKIGVLRAYVKTFKPQRQEKNKNLRHPKNLKIIEQFQMQAASGVQEQEVPQNPASPALSQLRSPGSFQSLSFEEGRGDRGDSNPFIQDVMASYEDRFFKNFQFLLDDPNDPFIQIDRNFKKKQLEQPSSDFFFF